MPEMVALKKLPAQTVVYKSGKGPYDLIPDTVQELNLWIKENGHTPAGQPIGVFLNNPYLPPEELLWEVRIPLKTSASLSHPHTDTAPGLKEIPDREVLVTTHEGSLDTLGSALQGLIRFMVANGYRLAAPPELVFLKDLVTTPAHQLEGEIRLTVEKRA
jgi:effector-binding domain-containing protein